jgi:prepilin-type N-terminal cleavage/methylation domain-containing protein
MKPSEEGGFSLIELMIAMVVTLVISGAVYGLIASGNTAFKRDPELAERQQNVRVAMDLIQRDILAAGTRMGPFAQVFTAGLDGAGAATPSGPTDALEMIGDAGDCPIVPVANPPIVGGNLSLALPVAAGDCLNRAPMALVFNNTGGSWGFFAILGGAATTASPNTGTPMAPCAGGADITACLPAGFVPTGITAMSLVRYQVANIPLDLDNRGNPVPGLYRSATGDLPAGGGAAVGGPLGGGNWQLVARGIEDFQVQYRTTAAPWGDTPPGVIGGNFGTIVREVRVTLRSRTINLEGSDVAGVNALRGDLTSVSVVRSALFYMVGNGWL